jgi:hypothetical protein
MIVLAALGLVLVSFADHLSRHGGKAAEPLFWVGLAAVAGPLYAGLFSRRTTDRERFVLAVALDLGIYLVDVLGAPLRFAQFAEMDQLRTLDDLRASGHLFGANPIGEVNPVFPGLSILADGLTNLTGMTPFAAGLAIVSLSRVLLVSALFKLLDTVSGSTRVAAAGVAIYAANPNFLQFSTQFSYETLGLALFMLILLALARHEAAPRRNFGTWGLAVVLVAGMVITHHISTYILVSIAAAWTLVTAIVGRERKRALDMLAFTLVAGGLVAAWLSTKGGPALDYLGAVFRPALHDLLGVAQGSSQAKVPFKASTGQLAPAWERWAGFASIGTILVSLPFGLWLVWKRYRRIPRVVLLACIAVSYPATLALRLTQSGAETSNRASDFVFIGLGLVIGIAATTLLVPADGGRRYPRLRPVAMFLGGLMLLIGGISIGTPRYSRQPGPYIVGADSRSVEPKGLSAAEWVERYRGAGKNILTDRSNRQLMGSYGREDPQTKDGGKVPGRSYVHVSELITSPVFGRVDQRIVRNKKIRFVEVDRRLTTALPLVGVYFERSEPHAYAHRAPIQLRALTKFDGVANVDRLYDNGDIQIYDVRHAVARP